MTLSTAEVLQANVPLILAGVALGLFLVGSWIWWIQWGRPRREQEAEAQIQREIDQGIYNRALPYLVERQRFGEAAELAQRRGDVEQAASLLLQAGDYLAAGRAYCTAGDKMRAARTFKKGGHLREAAEVYVGLGDRAAAAKLYEEAADFGQAAEQWRAVGQHERAAELSARSGDARSAATDRAQSSERLGLFADAARQWEQAGDIERALTAWHKAGSPRDAARVVAAGGDLARAARMLFDAELFRESAELFSQAGLHREAAEAAYRVGDVESAVRHLEVIGDNLLIARVLVSAGQRDAAKERLSGVKPRDKQYLQVLETLADMERADGRSKEAHAAYDRLVNHTVALAGARDQAEVIRRWVVTQSEIEVSEGNLAEGIARLRKLDDFGIMSPEIQDKVRLLVEQLKPSAPTELAAPATDTALLLLPKNERYKFTARIGQGGTGAIYRATDLALRRDLVVKMILPSQLPTDIAKEFFVREARVSAQLNHPNIVTVYDVGEMEGRLFIAMEYIEGKNLLEMMWQRMPVRPEELLPVVRQLCAALQYAHDQGVVHKDIKLENVMVTPQGKVKLMDFGLAQAIQESSDSRIVLAGTPPYMSPEQIEGTAVDHRTDIYALGVLLFRLVTARFPFIHEEGSVLEQHRMAPVPNPRTFNPKLSMEISRVLMRSLAKKKEDRFERSVAFGDAFEHAARA